MGVMRFKVHPLGLLDSVADIQHAYVSGYDGRVFPSRVEIDGNVVAIRRTNAESGKLNVAYPVQGFGKPVVSTSTLREQEAPYNLALELARGKICQVRNQLATWEALGMQIPVDFAGLHRESHKLFAQATAAQADVERSTNLANLAITKAHEAAERLTRHYVRQRLQVRFKRTPQLPVSFGCLVNGNDLAAHGTQLTETFNAVSVPVEWTRIEPEEGAYHWENCDAVVNWAHDRKLLMRGGPLLDFSENGLPSWLSQWSHDVLNLQSFLCDFVETAVARYQGKVRIWELASHANTGGAFKLNEEERLSVMARTLEVARQVDGDAQFFLRIDTLGRLSGAGGASAFALPVRRCAAALRHGTGRSESGSTRWIHRTRNGPARSAGVLADARFVDGSRSPAACDVGVSVVRASGRSGFCQRRSGCERLAQTLEQSVASRVDRCLCLAVDGKAGGRRHLLDAPQRRF